MQNTKTQQKKTKNKNLVIHFQDNQNLPTLYGIHDCNLRFIEQILGITLYNRGNIISIEGQSQNITKAHSALENLYQIAKNGGEINQNIIKKTINPNENYTPKNNQNIKQSTNNTQTINIGKHSVPLRSQAQAEYLKNMQQCQICFAIGPAGTGKTHLAVCYGAELLTSEQVERIIITRPAVEAGEKLGFLPGDVNEKFDPYLKPIYDALNSVLSETHINKMRANGTLEIAPLAFMRGRTLTNAFVMLDEAQNATTLQMKMFLTRLGEGSRMVITGDPSQIDLAHETSGLLQAQKILKNINGIAFNEFSADDIVRHKLVDKIVRAYEQK